VRHNGELVATASTPSTTQHSPVIFKMFVPRAVRLKGVKEPQRPKVVNGAEKPRPSKVEANSKDALAQAMGETSMNSPAPPQDTASDTAAPTRGPRFTVKPITPEYIAQLAAGVELIFTDYAHQEQQRLRWLRDRYRVIDGEENCGRNTQKYCLYKLIIWQTSILLRSSSTPISQS